MTDGAGPRRDRPGFGPRRRPPWWPDDEAWPPTGTAWRRNRWRDGPGRRGFGCIFGLIFLLVLGSVATLAVSVAIASGPVAGLAGLALVVAVVIAAAVAVGRTARTLDSLVAAARRVESGDYTARVPQPRRGPPPLRALVRGFNTMTQRLESDERQRRTLLADVSHELRTPLAVVQGNLEALIDGVYPADEAHLAPIVEETRVLARLVDDLRTLTLAEAGTLALHREPTDVGVIAADVAKSFHAAAERAGVTIEVVVAGDAPLLDADPVRTREIVSNLVANALRYTPSAGRITISAMRCAASRATPDAMTIAVTDTGAGMAQGSLDHVFDRFWKSSESHGSGLGLAIAKNLVEAHGGQIRATSEPGRGTTVSFDLPVERPAN